MAATVAKPIPIRSLPGVKRDGTQFEGDNYIDSQWCRWQRGLPRKMGGYQQTTAHLPELVRGMRVFNSNGQQYIYLGSENRFTQQLVNAAGIGGGQNDRTPAGFVGNANNLWQTDIMTDQATAISYVVAHAGQNLADIDSTVESNIYYGIATAATPLVATLADPVSGGVVILAPYRFSYGNSGRIDVGTAGDPNSVNQSAFVTGSKIVKGLPMRGSGSGPAGIFWSLDAVVRGTFDSTLSPIPFAFDTLSGESSIMSTQGVIEYDGIFYWLGVDRVLMFNGVVQEVPNAMNINWFFQHLNRSYTQKVFAFKVPRFGEIWWCFPYDSATECSHAIVYNVREKTWYDTQLPNAGRTAGYFAQVYSKPFMAGVDETATGRQLWQHETGVNEVVGSAMEPVPSHFETAEISMLTMQQSSSSQSLHVAIIEPDFVQAGPLTVRVNGRSNARAPNRIGETYTFPAVATNAEEEIVRTKEARRLMSFRFESNAIDGDYQMGQTMAHIQPADGRVTT